PVDDPSVSSGPVPPPPRAPPMPPPQVPARLTTDDQSTTLKKVDGLHPGPPIDATAAGTTAVVEPDTHSPLESDPYRTRGKNRRMVAIGTAVAMVGLGAIILGRVFSAPDPVVDTPPAATSSSAPAAASAPEITPGATVSAPVIVSSAPVAPAVSASAASSAK